MNMDQNTAKQIQKLLDQALINVATKDDLKGLATKMDLEQLRTDLIEEIKESEGFIVGSADKHKAEKTIVEDHERRLTQIESKFVAW